MKKLVSAGLLVLAASIAVVVYNSRGKGDEWPRRTPTPATQIASTTTLLPRKGSDLSTQVYLQRLQKIEASLREKCQQILVETKMKEEMMLAAAQEVEELSTDDISVEVVELGTALQNTFREEASAVDTITTIQEWGPKNLSATLNELASERRTTQESEMEHKVEAEVKAMIASSPAGLSGGIESTVRGDKQKSERNAAVGNIRNKITSEYNPPKMASEALEKLIDCRLRLLSCRAVASVLKKKIGDPPDSVILMGEMRGCHRREQWVEVIRKSERILQLSSTQSSPEYIETMLTRLHSRHRLGEPGIAEELRKFMERNKELSVSRPLNVFLGYTLLDIGEQNDALNKFDDCCDVTSGQQDNEIHCKLLGYHPKQAFLGKAAALMAKGQEAEARQFFSDILKQNTSAIDSSLLWHARKQMISGPAIQHMDKLKDIADIRILSPWVTRSGFISSERAGKYVCTK